MKREHRSLKKLKRSDQELTPWEKAQKQRQLQKKASKRYRNNMSRSFLKKLPQTNKLRKKRLAKGTLTLLIIFGILFIVSLIFVLPFSRILKINVNTKNDPIRTAVIKASDLHYYESLVPVWTKSQTIEKNIKDKVPSVEKVNVTNHGSQVNIEIKEYPIIGYVVQNSKYYQLTAAGMVSKYGTTNPTGNYPAFYNFKNKNILKAMTTQFDELQPKVKKDISEIHLEPTKADPEKIKLYMNDGNQVIATISTFAQKMQYYPSIVSKMNYTGVVDLEVGAFSYPYGKN